MNLNLKYLTARKARKQVSYIYIKHLLSEIIHRVHITETLHLTFQALAVNISNSFLNFLQLIKLQI